MNLERKVIWTRQKWAQFGPQKNFWRLKPPVPARNHCCLSKYAI